MKSCQEIIKEVEEIKNKYTLIANNDFLFRNNFILMYKNEQIAIIILFKNNHCKNDI